MYDFAASLAVFPSVARGKVSVPQAVTLSYTRAYHAAAPRSLGHLPCPALPRCPSCSVPSNLNPRMPASVIWVLSLASVGTYGGRNGGKFENDKK
ncbi:unnamed protein product [Staurois parvus]|uniref:Uncharacterized protein n=1 Tax=Staurois parvus TaxID=386267 RepID=A0ABN9BCI8_9NEOB|nr:unnamed protein product [Staurois parvus]